MGLSDEIVTNVGQDEQFYLGPGAFMRSAMSTDCWWGMSLSWSLAINSIGAVPAVNMGDRAGRAEHVAREGARGPALLGQRFHIKLAEP